MDLQTTYYVLGIIFMIVMLLLVAALLAAIYVIKRKVDEIHQRIEAKVNLVSSIAHLGGDIVSATKKVRRGR